MSIVRELANNLTTIESNVQDQIDSKIDKINITGNTIGSATHIPVITYNNQGQITSTTTASIDSLPSQTNQSGKYLTTDGASASWNTITQYTPPTDQGVNNYLAGDGDYKSIDISTLEYDNSLFNLNADNVQEALDSYAENFRYWENITSAVRMFGGIIQDNGDGTVRVGSGGGLFKLKASSTPGVPPGECEPMSLNSGQAGEIFYRTWTASNSITLTNNAYNYIFILWDHTINNGDGTYGNTKVYATTNFYLTDWENEIAYYNFVSAHPELDLPARRSGMLHAFTVGRVYRMDNEVTIRVCGTNGWNYNKRAQLFGEEFFPVVRARGLQIEAATGNLQFNVTEGIMWAEAANRFTVKGFNMDEGDKFTSWYRHTAIPFEGSYGDLTVTYPNGITDSPYAIVYATSSGKYYRYDGSEWSEVMDYIYSKPRLNPLTDLATIQSTYPNGFNNLSDGNDYVIIQLQATKQFYIFNESWEEYTSEISSNKTIVNFLGTLDELDTAYPNGYSGLINIIAPSLDGMFYEFNKTNGWESVQGYNNKSGWLRFIIISLNTFPSIGFIEFIKHTVK